MPTTWSSCSGCSAATLPSVVVVGHNPTVHELALVLLDDDDAEGRSRLEQGFPTAALAVVAVAIPSWARSEPGTGDPPRASDTRSLMPRAKRRAGGAPLQSARLNGGMRRSRAGNLADPGRTEELPGDRVLIREFIRSPLSDGDTLDPFAAREDKEYVFARRPRGGARLPIALRRRARLG